jgi:2-polyprenyl-3-methyl-5-hydroxy-6-metoxy-1,4-benzoquinol methylase
MLGGFDRGIEKNMSFFDQHGIKPNRSRNAVDLGAGCGFQSIPLAKAGFSVIAVDIDGKLLRELADHSGQLDIKIVQDDLMNFDNYTSGQIELIVCMTDTLLHLDSKDAVAALFNKVYQALETNGKFIATFRDLSTELFGLDRFIPIKSDDNIVFTCFLEYEPQTVKVYDIINKKERGEWSLSKSYYRKLKLSVDWVDDQFHRLNYAHVDSTMDCGFVTVIATK